MNYGKLASSDALKRAADALEKHGISTEIVENGAAAKKRVLELLPEGAEVMDMTSETLRTIGLQTIINDSGKYDSVRQKLKKMNRAVDGLAMQRIGAAPEWTIGSVQAVTESGQLVIASNTGSQLPAYAYGSSHVIWVVGAQKIVKNLDEAFVRIYQYVLPLESERARQAYGVPQSAVSKLLVINQEIMPNRAKVILIREKLGF